tara:strand:+ start:519 stop:725 length:207 start_codon:yes stop_codon:yes gene_type:complete
MDWLKSKLSSRSLLGPNSLFGQGVQTLADSGLKVGDVSFQPKAQMSMSNDELIKYASLATLVYLITKK